MEMLLNGTPKWTHITRNNKKAVIVTDKINHGVYSIVALVEDGAGLSAKIYTADLKHIPDFDSALDLRPYNPFEGLPVDTPIWVKRDGGHWYRRHFARYEGASVYVWTDGKTSFTQNGEVEYLTYSLTDPEEDDL